MGTIRNRKKHTHSHKKNGPPDVMQVMHRFEVWDRNTSRSLSVCANAKSAMPGLRPLMKVIEISCHGVTWLVGTVVVFLLSHRPSDVELLVNIFFLLLLDLLCVALVKALIQRPRPATNEMDMFATISVDKYSFPSGHTSRAAMLAYLFTERLVTDGGLRGLVWGWGVVVGASRLMLGRHYVTDVVCGFLLGLAEYGAYNKYLWVAQDTCLQWLETYFGHVHL